MHPYVGFRIGSSCGQSYLIVRNLAGYTLGRSDLVRRAMSKKKAEVMEKERQNFVYGNEAEGVLGCIAMNSTG